MTVGPSLRKRRGVASFDAWRCARVDDERWETHRRRLETLSHRLPAQALARAVGTATRLAALLGAVPDGSATYDRQLFDAVAREQTGWAAALDRQRPSLRFLFESQLAGYQRLHLEAIAGTALDQSFIAGLHAMVCANQRSYMVVEEIDGRSGIFRRPLPKGRYKRLANHAARAAGHEYPAVSEIAAAMDAFADELATDAYLHAHPVLQASYALHRLTAIHPFPDGNGRVGRALASVAFFRALSIPLLFESDARLLYLDALRHADDGDVLPLVEFVTTCACSTTRFVLESAFTGQTRPHLDTE